jgi:SAM-dependent methyltransferase
VSETGEKKAFSRAVTQCRLCGNSALTPVLDLGEQAFTGIFPCRTSQPLPRGPLQLVKCDVAARPDACGLLQLRHTFDPGTMYGENYGYRSGLNRSMVEHLQRKVEHLRRLVPLGPGDLVLDIGSNDGTTLSFYPPGEATLVGIDPTGAKFRSFYRADIQLLPDFFSAAILRRHFPARQAKIVTSIAMFYDLDEPLRFMQEVALVLAPDGLWHFEQSYMPLMLQQNSYDTACHEHLEYYALRQIKWMADRNGLKLVDLSFNDINGGSFAVTAAPAGSPLPESPEVRRVLDRERTAGLDGLVPYEAFRRRVAAHRDELVALLRRLKAEGRQVFGYGASTKGNVLLQYCGLTAAELPCIAEVNPDKFGCFTPGTNIPIVSEAEALARRPDFFLVLPWHFRDGILRRETAFLEAGGRFLFPLPQIEIVPP